eukprot:3473898-Pleurochrysis_carterae.AAC.1
MTNGDATKESANAVLEVKSDAIRNSGNPLAIIRPVMPELIRHRLDRANGTTCVLTGITRGHSDARD